MSAHRGICLFDVNETLLDLASLDPHFDRAFGDPPARREWFQQLLQSAFAATMMDAYSSFAVIGEAALHMVAARRGLELTQSQRDDILQAVRRMPPYPDVQAALERLRAAGFRLATLTNSPPSTVEPALERAGIAPLFERILSVDAVRRYKPAPEPYRMAARELDVAMGEITMIACHGWDVAGAMMAGCRAAFVFRPGSALDPLFPSPGVVGRDLGEVAEGIIAAG